MHSIYFCPLTFQSLCIVFAMIVAYVSAQGPIIQGIQRGVEQAVENIGERLVERGAEAVLDNGFNNGYNGNNGYNNGYNGYDGGYNNYGMSIMNFHVKITHLLQHNILIFRWLLMIEQHCKPLKFSLIQI